MQLTGSTHTFFREIKCWLLVFIIVLVSVNGATAGVINEEFLERGKNICEPRLLQRRAAEERGQTGRFMQALLSNSVFVKIGRTICSGTFITPTCVLTAAHCLDDGDHSNIKTFNKFDRLDRGQSVYDQHYKRTDKGKGIKRGTVSGDDIGLVLFDRPFKPFKNLKLSYTIGNLNTWFSEATKTDYFYGSDLQRFDNAHWQDFGTLGLTGFTPKKSGEIPQLCSDSAFNWSPCFSFIKGQERTPKFERGVLCTTGEFGPGMSGGAFYDEHNIFAINIEGPIADKQKNPNFIKVPNHHWYRHPRSFFSSNLALGTANRVKVILETDQKFIQKHCPAAEFVQRKPTPGLFVRDPKLSGLRGTNRFWLPGGKDVWRKLRLNNRLSRVNTELREGNQGEFVRRLQIRLRKLKLYRGPIDGAYGPSTGNAVRKFQVSESFRKKSGAADKKTLIALGIWFNQRN